MIYAARSKRNNNRMMKIRLGISSLLLTLLLAEPAAAAKLNSKEEARVARAAPEDQDAVRECLLRKKKGKKTGTIVGTAAGAGTSVIAGGNVGVTALAAGAGALVGRAIGDSTSTNKTCDEILAVNK
jgi:outer membrane lipoprotein SlyB